MKLLEDRRLLCEQTWNGRGPGVAGKGHRSEQALIIVILMSSLIHPVSSARPRTWIMVFTILGDVCGSYGKQSWLIGKCVVHSLE